MRTLVILLLSLLSYAVPAQENIMFKHLTVHDGLADNEVKCILKDNNGFLWCSTNTAINRYDGYNVKQYPNTSNGLSLSASIEQIQMDYNGDIWINRYGHYFIYDREKDQLSMPSLYWTNTSFITTRIRNKSSSMTRKTSGPTTDTS